MRPIQTIPGPQARQARKHQPKSQSPNPGENLHAKLARNSQRSLNRAHRTATQKLCCLQQLQLFFFFHAIAWPIEGLRAKMPSSTCIKRGPRANMPSSTCTSRKPRAHMLSRVCSTRAHRVASKRDKLQLKIRHAVVAISEQLSSCIRVQLQLASGSALPATVALVLCRLLPPLLALVLPRTWIWHLVALLLALAARRR